MIEPVWKPSPHFSRRNKHPTMVVIHGDAGETDAGTVSWIQDPASNVSYHYLVGRDGTVYQFVREQDKAWHAGVSKWHGREVGSSVNAISVGVCFANDGEEDYREVQYLTGAELVANIISDWGINANDVVGHYEVSPGRKTDPWEHFDWRRFMSEIAEQLR